MTARRASIRRRLVGGVALGVAVVLAVAGGLVHALVKGALADQLDRSIADEAAALAVLVEQDGDELDTDLAPSTLASTPGRVFALYAPGGAVVTASAALAGARLAPAPLAAPGRAFGDARLPGGARGRQVTLAFHPRQEHDDAAPLLVTLVVARDRREVAETLARVDTGLAIAGVVAVALAIGLLAWVGRAGLAPVRALAQQIAAVDPERPEGGFAAPDAPVELATIAARLDELLARLAEVVARERELTGEVAHELRTPLAGLRATIELALAREREPARYRDALATCLQIVDQTHRMVEGLLALARLDAGLVTATRAPVALAALVDEALAAAAGPLAAQKLAVVRTPGDAIAASDPERLRIVVRNLVDNAASHADVGGTVTVGVAADGDRAVLRVANTGSAVAAGDVGKVFARFWRGDAARTAGLHAGLGLALCRKLVELVGGTIAVDSTTGGEFVVTVHLPRAADDLGHDPVRGAP